MHAQVIYLGSTKYKEIPETIDLTIHVRFEKHLISASRNFCMLILMMHLSFWITSVPLLTDPIAGEEEGKSYATLGADLPLLIADAQTVVGSVGPKPCV